jgi:pilus assembly protein Flp/PilA
MRLEAPLRGRPDEGSRLSRTLLVKADSSVKSIYESAVRFFNEKDGATVVEYVLMLVLIAIVCIAGVSSIGNITSLFYGVANTL